MASSGMPGRQPYPGASFFMNGTRPAIGKRSRVFTAMGERLVAVGCGQFQEETPGPVLTPAHVESYEEYLRQLGVTGLPSKWPPGRTSWDRLRVRKV
ncbi:hypothetical protein [Streptomyces sp. TRM68367]|uniref:hypothetical protein n=1 Tax=Streptomyces sp. TRM68367 TaxID=2758415 RepID=UPI00165B307E|nr:hypothetical protein [Streptomyces sp. TRM68367]MBC9729243.1 hypothetical protein [Streptomyces sp. TRM68367]